jgi:hypothetical protein
MTTPAASGFSPQSFFAIHPPGFDIPSPVIRATSIWLAFLALWPGPSSGSEG